MSFPRYPKYKDSGVAWLGEVPAHWGLSRLKNLFALMKRPPEEGDEIVTAFRDGEVTLRANRRVDGFTNAVHEHGYQRLLNNDLVIHAMDAFAGAIGVSDSVGKSTPVYSVCRAKSPSTVPQYYGRLLRHMALAGYINSLAKGIRERSTEFRWSEAAEVVVAAPPGDEQDSINAFLDRETAKIDGLVAEQRRLIELLKEKRQAVISHAVTKGLNPDAPMKPSGIEWPGDVPKHWEVIRIGRKIELQRGADITKDAQNVGDVPVVSSGGIASFHDRALVGGPGVVVGRKGTAGSIYYVERDYWPHDTTLYVKQFGGNHPRFVYYKLHSMDLASYDTGSANPTINRNLIHPVQVSWPPNAEQVSVASYLDEQAASFAALTAEADRAIDLLQERRTALISAAVTGKIDVRGLACGGEAA